MMISQHEPSRSQPGRWRRSRLRTRWVRCAWTGATAAIVGATTGILTGWAAGIAAGLAVISSAVQRGEPEPQPADTAPESVLFVVVTVPAPRCPHEVACAADLCCVWVFILQGRTPE